VALNAPIAAVLLAGGRRDQVCAGFPDAPNKAFVPVAGISLARRTLAALQSTHRVGRVIAVAPLVERARIELARADEIRPDGATMSQSLRSGLGGLPSDDLVLVAASDLPILSAAAIEEFLDLAQQSRADLVYACVERRCHEERFPEVPHTWARLRDGTYCGAGLFALRPRTLDALDRFLGRLGAARKNPLRLASIFGYDVLLRYALRALTIAAAERRATALLGAPVAAAICTHPEIAVNVDRHSDLALAEVLVATSSG
jgi:molybdopterin-guanine dinucleotide biosynthesis protein A